MILRPFCLALLSWLLLALACGSPEERKTALTLEPIPLGNQEDALCGMLVREQSAPRGQLIHRDGTHQFFCSVADLLAYLDAPSPHGRVDRIFFESLDPSEDPAISHLEEHAWIGSGNAFFVVGVERKGIMGPPVLVYEDRAAAESVLMRYREARMLDFEALRGWWTRRQEEY
jgi:nitrous oxide reductase accessory protein NosL